MSKYGINYFMGTDLNKLIIGKKIKKISNNKIFN